jgi:uncharacterized membrane protein
MASPDDTPAFEARLDVLHAHVLQLSTRLDALEHERYAPRTAPVPRHTEPPRPPTSMAVAPLAPADTSAPPPAASEAGSMRGPVHALAIAGGGALLLGLVWFVAYAIEQDWLPPGVRFFGAALLSALLTLAAWPVARRGHESVAGALGGAGLGAWFASWLVARHAHELVSGPQTLAALVAGAAACLLIADRLRLRLMAVLATVAACATPLLVALGSGRLVELMVYQLAVVLVLMLVDWRRRWPELPTLALMAAWMLGGRWASEHLGPDNAGAFMLWSLVLLIASAVSGWRLLIGSAATAEHDHARGRLIVAGLASWGAAAWAFEAAPQTLALASLGLGVWHAALAVLLHRHAHGRTSGVFLGLAWAQGMVAGALMLTGAALGWWWIGMAALALVVRGSPVRRLRTPLLLAPTVAAVGWALAHGAAAWALGVGLLAAALPLVACLLELGRVHDEHGDAGGSPTLLAVTSTLLWAAVVVVLGPATVPAKLLWSLVPIVVVNLRVVARPSAGGSQLATQLLGLGTLAALAAIVVADALDPTRAGAPAAALALALPLAGLIALGVALGWRASRLERAEVGPIGLLVALQAGLVLALGVAIVSFGHGEALGQVGYTLCAALTGLGLLVAGLRLRQGSWRQLGLAAITAAGIKVVLVDLATAAVVWRALSFVGIGAILIAGAFAYSRAQQRLATPPS